ncbi:Probable zinc metalloprotease EGY2, chloroplastic [Linum grandiflorum]
MSDFTIGDYDKTIEGEAAPRVDSLEQQDLQPDSPPTVLNQATTVNGETKAEGGTELQQLDESFRIPKETIDILKDQVFGFDTFFVTSQEPYQGGVLFKGNLRGQAAKSYDKIANRLKNKFGNEYKVFLLTNPEDDKPVAVVVPSKTMQSESTPVPEWFAAGAFGLVAKDVGIELGFHTLFQFIAKLLLGDALKEGSPISINPLVIWAWPGLLINAINSIPAGELDGGRIFFAIWGRKIASRITGASVVLLGLSLLFNDISFYWVVLIFFLQRGPIAPISE